MVTHIEPKRVRHSPRVREPFPWIAWTTTDQPDVRWGELYDSSKDGFSMLVSRPHPLNTGSVLNLHRVSTPGQTFFRVVRLCHHDSKRDLIGCRSVVRDRAPTASPSRRLQLTRQGGSRHEVG